MSSSNSTLTSLWVEDGSNPPRNVVQLPPPTSSVEEMFKLYKESGLEMGKASGVMTQTAHPTIQGRKVIALQVPASVASALKLSPFKIEQASLIPKGATFQNVSSSPVIVSSTPTRVVAQPASTPLTMSSTSSPAAAAQIMASSNHFTIDSPQIMASSNHFTLDSPQWQFAVKRQVDLVDTSDFLDSKRIKKSDKCGKGLRHFSMKVCEKVRKKGVTTYNEVADELVSEFSDPRNMSPSDQGYDQKNIRRRVYDALNVLMAMNIISKEKKEIRWIGLPTNSAQECQTLEVEKQSRIRRIQEKKRQLQDLILQQVAFKNVVQRNRQCQRIQGQPSSHSAIHLPYIIINTSKKTVIDCSISNDKYEYLFNFDNTFEIHDDIEVLKRMGMTYGLEKGQCMNDDLRKACKLVPKVFEPYVIDLANSSGGSTSSSSSNHSNLGSILTNSNNLQNTTLAYSTTCAGLAGDPSRGPVIAGPVIAGPVINAAGPISSVAMDAADAEVAMTTHRALSRQSSVGSFSDLALSRAATDTSELFSDEDESERSSPVE